MFKKLIILLITFGILGLTSCGKEPTEEEIKSFIKESLYAKYEIDVDISTIEKQNGEKAFQDVKYHTNIAYNQNNFDVYVNKNLDKMEDTYAKYEFDEIIKKSVHIGFINNSFLSDKDYYFDIIYVPTSDEYTNISEYFDISDSYVNITMKLKDKHLEDLGALYKVLTYLENQGIHFSVTCNYGTEKIYIQSNNSIQLKSLEGMKKDFDKLS